MKPTDILMHEHQVVLHMLSGAEKQLQAIESTQKVDVKKVEKIIDFSRNFTDACHHAKEERHFFVRLVERGMSKEQGPIMVMLYEHSVGRDLIRSMDQALDEVKAGKKETTVKVAQNLHQYIELLRAHIMKENNILFPMSDQYLSTNDQSDLEKAFDKLEKEETGEGIHEKYHQMAHEIAQ